MSFSSKKILLGISGGIAAYKTVELARLLVQAGAQVQCVITDTAQQFVAPVALQAVTGRVVRQSLWDSQAEAAMGHIELARWADILLIAPASADIIARLAQGIANDLLTTLALATQAQCVIAPAMNGHMWRHPATQRNIAQLNADGIRVLPPESGELACGDVDVGRMPSPERIVKAIQTLMVDPLLQGQRVLITAGPTFEDIDPVRFIANRSSGKMGFAMAQAARDLGAEVTLIAGPVALSTPAGIKRIDVRNAEQMYAKVQAHFANSDWFIAAAAVADYRVENMATHKLKKQHHEALTLKLVPNPDIVAWAAAQPNRGKVIAFAAETEQLETNARAKLQRKRVDAVLANSVAGGAGFEQNDNCLTLITANKQIDLGCASKRQLAITAIKQLVHEARSL
jgi:phosphopantothenoylcysteine decarboxylase/phosphopantothenate--cysteine ligase